jgi:methionyl-tRNA formyltransferase
MRVVVLGRSEALYGVLEKLVVDGHEVTAIVSPKEAPEYARTSEDFRNFAFERGIPFSPRVNMDDLRKFLAVGNPEVGVSMNYPVVISAEVIDSLPLGILNIHGGDLPRYRGNACQAWAILNGEEKIGLCVHKMVGDQLDSGDIISRDYLEINGSTSITAVHEWLVQTSPGLVGEALERLEKNPSFFLEKQSESGRVPLRSFPRRPEDGRLDWHQPSERIVRLIKASSRPYRGAFCFFEGKEIIIWDAELGSYADSYLAVPGQVVAIKSDSVLVAGGEGTVRITEWQVLGDRLPMGPFLRSLRQRLS